MSEQALGKSHSTAAMSTAMSATARALASVATCNLCQWAMDFDTNLANVRRSILIAKSRGCALRTGPELELTGCGAV